MSHEPDFKFLKEVHGCVETTNDGAGEETANQFTLTKVVFSLGGFTNWTFF